MNKLIESHPELCFAKLNRNQPILENKCMKEGEQKRLEVLQKYYPDARLVVDKYLADVPYRKKTDDVIDALCLAVTGMIGNENGYVTIPKTLMMDKIGLRMQMVFKAFAAIGSWDKFCSAVVYLYLRRSP